MHHLWLKKFLKNKNNKIYLIKFNKKNVGYIRIERKGSKYLTSWAIVKKYHGRGIATKNLKKATKNKKITYTKIIL